jgi:hypothetical protein
MTSPARVHPTGFPVGREDPGASEVLFARSLDIGDGAARRGDEHRPITGGDDAQRHDDLSLVGVGETGQLLRQ